MSIEYFTVQVSVSLLQKLEQNNKFDLFKYFITQN